jgi:hypothetical protein
VTQESDQFRSGDGDPRHRCGQPLPRGRRDRTRADVMIDRGHAGAEGPRVSQGSSSIVRCYASPYGAPTGTPLSLRAITARDIVAAYARSPFCQATPIMVMTSPRRAQLALAEARFGGWKSAGVA